MGCVLAVYLFVCNLSQLSTSLVHLTSTKNAVSLRDVELCRAQYKLSDLSSKYTMLFAFAIASTIVFVLLQFSLNSYFRGPFFKIDFCVNLWCMYLQFGFAGK